MKQTSILRSEPIIQLYNYTIDRVIQLKQPYHIHCALKLRHKMLNAMRKQANFDSAVCCP